MGEEQHETRTVFSAVVALNTPGERTAYLDRACQGKPELRQRVEALLQAHQRAGRFLEAGGAEENQVREQPGTVIGRYKLLEQIGEGGFGVVFMAEQLEPIRRRVALKIVKPGMDTRQVIARFEAERQALALMDHPSIAKVFDAGATATGRPYFVMELVNGIPITDYCDQRELSTIERLRLFIKVGQAVQHAHQKGIVHRDLKPSNILVTVIDGEAVPKIIDFGVAKALGQQLTEKTLFTAFQQLIGTPAYMSPEQAELSGVEVDTRSDIYSMGVLLYELLTGVTPFDAEMLRQAALEDLRRLIRETEPPKPSTRLRTLGAKLTEVAQHRNTNPAALSRLVHGELDWIVMKALEKDRARRYDTAVALVEDLRHHLEHEPVVAGPPGMAYRLGKFSRRRRKALMVAGGLAVVICAVAALSKWQSGKTQEAERRAAFTRKELKSALGEPASGHPGGAPQAKGLFNGISLVEKAAALSPDEKYLGYSDWAGQEGGVVVRQLESGKISRFTGRGKDDTGLYAAGKELYAGVVGTVTTNRPGIFEMPFEGYLWSPDSKWLAYLWIRPPGLCTELRILSPEAGDLRVVLPGSTNVYYDPLDWSPDGKWLVCCRLNERALALVSIPGGQIRELDPLDPNGPSDAFSTRPHARFSPDGKYVVYDLPTGEGERGKQPHSLYVTEVATGTRRPLNIPGNCHTPIWSPNQPVVLFTSDRLGTWDLWGVRVQDGRVVSEAFPVQYGFGCFDLRLARSGKLLVYRDVKPGDGFTIAAAGPTLEPLKIESLPGRVYFSMEGRGHALAVRGAKASVTPTPSHGQPSRVLHGGHRWFLEIRSLPTVGTNEPRRELFAMRDDADPSQAIQLTDRPPQGQMAGALVFSIGLISPGRESNRIINWARDVNRGLEDGLISWSAMKPWNPGPSAGPPPMPGIHFARLAFDAQGSITGLAEPVSTEPLVPEASNHDWSSDGRRLVYASPGRMGGTNVLKILHVETGQSSTLTPGEAPVWSPDGNWIAFHRRNASLHIVRPDGSDLRTLGRMELPVGFSGWLPPAPGFYRMVWSPDSKGMVYEYWEYGGLNTTYHELFYRPLDGDKGECLTRHLRANASPIAWLEGER